MPELPEVETTRRGLDPHLRDRRITAIDVHEPRPRWPVPPDLARLARGQRVIGLRRRAKYLIIDLERGAVVATAIRLATRLAATSALVFSGLPVPAARRAPVAAPTTDVA